jgi:hypothetical protein
MIKATQNSCLLPASFFIERKLGKNEFFLLNGELQKFISTAKRTFIGNPISREKIILCKKIKKSRK